MTIFFLFLFGPSILGFSLICASCFLSRSRSWLVGAFGVGVLLHSISALILYRGGIEYGEPSADRGGGHHTFAACYFLVGLLFLACPILFKHFKSKL